MAKQTKKQLATDYFNLTGARAPKRWTLEQLEEAIANVGTTDQQLECASCDTPVKPGQNLCDDCAQDATGTVETVHTSCCGTSKPKAETFSLSAGQHYCEYGHGCKADKTPSNPLAAVAKAKGAAKAAKANKKQQTKAPAYPVHIACAALPTSINGKPVARQIQVILNTILRDFDGVAERGALFAALDANNNNSTEVAATYTHDMQARQPVKNVYSHYNKRLVEAGIITVIKTQAEMDAYLAKAPVSESVAND